MLYLPRDPTPSAVFYRTARVTVLLLICWVCVGGLRGGLLAHSADSVSKHDRIVAQCTMRLVYKVYKVFQISSVIVSVS